MSSSESTKMSTAGRCVALHVRVLRAAGFMRARGGGEHAHGVYRVLVLAFTALYLLQECIYAYQERRDMDKLSRVMFLLICHFTSIVKQILFHWDADRIDDLLLRFDEPLLNKAKGAHALARSAAVARRWVRAYAGCAAFTCLLWALYHALRRVANTGDVVEFPFWTAFDTQRPVVFVLILFYSYYVTTLVAIANTTMDAFMATILYLCKTELSILRTDLENLSEQAKDLCTKTGQDYETALMTLFIKSCEHYKKVTEILQLFEDIFGTAIFVQFAIGGWILCMAAYKLVSLHVLSIEFASMILFIICILTELFLYCYYGNELKVESEYVGNSAFAMRWASAPLRFQRCLLLLLLRAGRPLRPAAVRLVPLSLETFVKILKSSYTFYAVLRQTK